MKNLVFSVIILLTFIVGITGCDQQNKEVTPTPTVNPTSSPTPTLSLTPTPSPEPTLTSRPTPPAGFKMYSDYGITFTYPETYSLSKDVDDSYGQISIYGDIDSGQESFNISWWDIDSLESPYDDSGEFINLEEWIQLPDINEVAPLVEAGCYLEAGNLTEITTLGHEVLYQTYHTGCTSLGNSTDYAVAAALECENTNRMFTLSLSSSFSDNDNDLVNRFMNHLDNLVCHPAG